VGVHWRQPEFLLPALDQLGDVRLRRVVLERQYAEWRRSQKSMGHRSPPSGEVTPSRPKRWHGDEQAGAWYALTTWLQRGSDPALSVHMNGSVMLTVIERAIHDPGGLSVGDSESLQACLQWARRQTDVVGWERDPRQYHLAWTMQHLLGQLHVLVHGATRLGVVWRF
jgi:hypothetical protein